MSQLSLKLPSQTCAFVRLGLIELTRLNITHTYVCRSVRHRHYTWLHLQADTDNTVQPTARVLSGNEKDPVKVKRTDGDNASVDFL